MKYEHIIGYVANTLWAIDRAKLDQILSVLAFRAAGHQFSADEIETRIGSAAARPTQPTGGSVAVLSLRGTLAHRMDSMEESSGGCSAERFAQQIQMLAADPRVGTIVIDVDSPGGTIPGVMEAADAVWAARASKRVVAVANSMMASAAYWIASQAHELVAIPSALDRCIGSIGVFTVHADIAEKLKQEGVKMTLISAGKNKAAINPFTPLTDDQRAEIQASVDAVYVQFLAAVARGRGVSVAQVKEQYGDGRAFSAPDAKAAGLIDRLATMEQVLAGLMPSSRAAAGAARAEIRVMVCDCSPDCACQQGGVCGEECQTCKPDCACVTEEAEPIGPSGPVDARQAAFHLL